MSSKRAGFTLLEMVITAALVGVIGLAIAATLRAARDVDRRITSHSENRAADRVVLDRIAKDLRGLLPYCWNVPNGISGNSNTWSSSPNGTTGAGAALIANSPFTNTSLTNIPSLTNSGLNTGTFPLIGYQNVRSGGEALSLPNEEAAADAAASAIQAPSPPYNERDQLCLAIAPGPLRFGSTWPAGGGSVQYVEWEVDDDPTTPERGLVRRPCTIVPCAYPSGPLSGVPAEPCEVVCASACGIMFRYWDPTSSTWDTTWDCGQNAVLPQAIEVSVAIRDADGTIRRLVTVVAPLTGRQQCTLLTATGS
jgi:prepilin-type N-terminal cleavage/methylation domain-containing protein